MAIVMIFLMQIYGVFVVALHVFALLRSPLMLQKYFG